MIGVNLVNLAALQRLMDQPGQARASLSKALTHAGAATPSLFAGINESLADLVIDQKNAAQAAPFLVRAEATVRALPASATKVDHLVRIAALTWRAQSGMPPSTARRTLALLADASRISREIGYARGLSAAEGLAGQIAEDTKQFDAAHTHTERALTALLSVDAPELKYKWYWQLGRLLERTPARQADAIEAYHRSIEIVTDLRSDLIQDRRTQTSFRQIVEPLFLAYADLRLRDSRARPGSPEEKIILAETRNVIEELKNVELRDYYGDECVVQLQRKERSLDDILPDHTAALYPIILKDRLELIVSLPRREFRRAKVVISRDEFDKAVRAYREGLQNTADIELFMAPSKRLYDLLIRPVRKALDDAGIQTIVFVPDGPLRSIPLSALNDGNDWNGFLIKRFAVAVTPSLKLLDPQPFPRTRINVFVAGLTKQVGDFAALQNVKQEIDEVSKLFDAKALEDEAFTVSAVSSDLSETAYQVVHLATHGHFDSDPAKTFLLTYAPPHITLDALEGMIKRTSFRTAPVELLFLSACETAVGDDQAALGLAGIAVKSGARSAVATLWVVGDRPAAQLATEFYQILKNTNVSKAEALRQAQVRILENPEYLAYQHPGNWSPFLLIGNWM
jgi:CHAT domain-containing protein